MARGTGPGAAEADGVRAQSPLVSSGCFCRHRLQDEAAEAQKQARMPVSVTSSGAERPVPERRSCRLSASQATGPYSTTWEQKPGWFKNTSKHQAPLAGFPPGRGLLAELRPKTLESLPRLLRLCSFRGFGLVGSRARFQAPEVQRCYGHSMSLH